MYSMYTICDSHMLSLESVVCMLSQENVDAAFLQEVKSTGNIYKWRDAGCKIVATDAQKRHQGRVSVIWRMVTIWKLKNFATYGPSILRILRTPDPLHWHIVFMYTPPMGRRGIH